MPLVIRKKENQDHIWLHLERQNLDYQEAISTFLGMEMEERSYLGDALLCILAPVLNPGPCQLLSQFWWNGFERLTHFHCIKLTFCFEERLHKNDPVYWLNAKLTVPSNVFAGSLSLASKLFHLSFVLHIWLEIELFFFPPTNISSAYILNSIH